MTSFRWLQRTNASFNEPMLARSRSPVQEVSNFYLQKVQLIVIIDADLQRFFNEYFVDTDSDDDDDDVEFEGFTLEGIRGRPVYLINSCRDRQIASESDSHIIIDIGLPTGLTMIPSIGMPHCRSTYSSKNEGPTCVTIWQS